jgi:hypothetical protein
MDMIEGNGIALCVTRPGDGGRFADPNEGTFPWPFIWCRLIVQARRSYYESGALEERSTLQPSGTEGKINPAAEWNLRGKVFDQVMIVSDSNRNF